MIWQMMMALLHSNRQLRTESMRQRKDVKNLLCSRKQLMMMTDDDDDDDDDAEVYSATWQFCT